MRNQHDASSRGSAALSPAGAEPVHQEQAPLIIGDQMTVTSENRALKVWAGLSVTGLILLLGILFLHPDLRGWTPPKWTNPAITVKPVRPSDAPFTVGDCLPGTIDAHSLPSTQDYDGAATETIFTCRSQSSAAKVALIYLLLVLAYPAYFFITDRRRQ